MGVSSATAGRDVVELGPEDTRWMRFVAGVPQTSAFHEAGWLTALTASYGYRPLVLALIAPGGEVIAGLPLIRIRRPLSGVTYVSLPFTDYCPPLARDEDALFLLGEGLEHWRRSVGMPAVEVRGRLPGTSSLTADFALLLVVLVALAAVGWSLRMSSQRWHRALGATSLAFVVGFALLELTSEYLTFTSLAQEFWMVAGLLAAAVPERAPASPQLEALRVSTSGGLPRRELPAG